MVSRGRYVFVYTSYKAYSLQSSNGTNYIPTAPKPVSYGDRVLQVLLGIGRGLQITNDDDASSPIRLIQWREAKERTVRGP